MKLPEKYRVETGSNSTAVEDGNYPIRSILVSPSTIDS